LPAASGSDHEMVKVSVHELVAVVPGTGCASSLLEQVVASG
jgi:hypothetical protein